MDTTVSAYLVYLLITVPLVVLVGWTLHSNGRTFLVEIFQGKEELADSINHLLVVGFYLFNIGFVTLAMRLGARPMDAVDAIETTSTKVGAALIVLGGLHISNLFMFSRLRWRVRFVTPPPETQGASDPELFGRTGPQEPSE